MTKTTIVTWLGPSTAMGAIGKAARTVPWAVCVMGTL